MKFKKKTLWTILMSFVIVIVMSSLTIGALADNQEQGLSAAVEGYPASAPLEGGVPTGLSAGLSVRVGTSFVPTARPNIEPVNNGKASITMSTMLMGDSRPSVVNNEFPPLNTAAKTYMDSLFAGTEGGNELKMLIQGNVLPMGEKFDLWEYFYPFAMNDFFDSRGGDTTSLMTMDQIQTFTDYNARGTAGNFWYQYNLYYTSEFLPMMQDIYDQIVGPGTSLSSYGHHDDSVLGASGGTFVMDATLPYHFLWDSGKYVADYNSLNTKIENTYNDPYFATLLSHIDGIETIKLTGTGSYSSEISDLDDNMDTLNYEYSGYFGGDTQETTPSTEVLIMGELYPAVFNKLTTIEDYRPLGKVNIFGFYRNRNSLGTLVTGGVADVPAATISRPLDGSGVVYSPQTSASAVIFNGNMGYVDSSGLSLTLNVYGGKIDGTNTATWDRVSALNTGTTGYTGASIPTRPDLFAAGLEFNQNEIVLNIMHDTFSQQISPASGTGIFGPANIKYRAPNHIIFTDGLQIAPPVVALSAATTVQLPKGITGMIVGNVTGGIDGVSFQKSTVEYSGGLNLGGAGGKEVIKGVNIGFSLWAPGAIVRFDNSLNLFKTRLGYSPDLDNKMHHLILVPASLGYGGVRDLPDEIFAITDNLQIGIKDLTSTLDNFSLEEIYLGGNYNTLATAGMHIGRGFGYGETNTIPLSKPMAVLMATTKSEIVYAYDKASSSQEIEFPGIESLTFNAANSPASTYFGFKYSTAKKIILINAGGGSTSGIAHLYVSPDTAEIEVFKESANNADLITLNIDGAGKYQGLATSVDTASLAIKNNYTGILGAPTYDSPLDSKFAGTGAPTPETISYEVIASAANTPYDGLSKLTIPPTIDNWSQAPSGTAELNLASNIIETVDSAASLGYSEVTNINIKNNGTQVLDLSGVSPNNLEAISFRDGNPNLRILNLSGSTNMSADAIKNVAQDTAGTDVATLVNLEEVNFNGCIDLAATAADISYPGNKISSFSLQNIPATGGSSIASLDLTGNKLKSIDTNSANPSEVVSGAGKTTGLSFAGATEVTGLVNLGANELTKAWFDGGGFNHLNVEGQVNIPNSTIGILLPLMTDGVKASNNASLTDVTFYGTFIGNLIANNSPNFVNLNGTKHHSGTPGTSGIIGGLLDLEGNTAFAGAWGNKLNLNGHAIEAANLPDFVLSEINLSYQNAFQEDVYNPAQGVLVRVNLANAQNLALLDVKYNSIEQIDNTTRLRLFGARAIVLTNTNLAPNAVIDADFNNIRLVTLDGPSFATDTLKTLYLEDNLLTDLSLQNMANLSELFVGRTMANRNLFDNGRVILRNSTKITSFAPGTSLAADQALDADYTRAIPIEPSERHWGTVGSPGGLRGALMRDTITPAGFYTVVPIKELDVRGATGLVTLRVPGNRLTNATMQVDTSASALEFIDISGAPFLANGVASVSSPRTRFNMPVSAIVGKQDPASGNITGTFKGVWPNLKTLYIQNNKLSGFEVGTSTGLEHILAYQNLITNIEVASAASLTVLDIERNLLTKLTVPTAKLRILRAGQNKLFNNPNVSNIPTLEQLYLNHNLLSSDLTLNSPNIKVLNLSENRYEIIPNVSKYASLQELYAYGNMASNILNFSANGALKILDLANNRLTGIPTLPASIVYLDLSDNRFGHILSISGGLPAGLSQATDYTARMAHEVYSRDRANPTEFRGTFAIENNQITKLPDSLKQAFIDMQNNVPGRAIYNIYLDYNILDIDVYNTDPSAVGPDGLVVEFTGTQKWLTARLNDKAYLQIYAPKEDIYKEVVRSLALFNPARGLITNPAAYEEPFKVQEFDVSMSDPNWTDYITPGTKSIIRQSGVILIDVYIIENLGRNGRVGVPLWLSKEGLIDYNLYGDTGGVGGGVGGGTTGDTGKTSGDGNYNPNTGGKSEEK